MLAWCLRLSQPARMSAAEQGFRMPAEWTPQEAVWLSWPVDDPRHWGGAKRDLIHGKFAEIAATISRFEPVRINAPEAEHDAIRSLCNRAKAVPERVELFDHPHNDVWCRDHGPIFVKHGDSGETAVTDWGFNAWGGKFPPFDLDDSIPRQIATALGKRVFDGGMILEGGAIEVNGAGQLLTTEAVLLNPNRNPHLGRDEIEQRLRDGLGVKEILWLEKGIEGDDTDGHIDDITRFVSAGTIVTALEDDPADENYEPLQENLKRLQGMTDQNGQPFRIVTIPMPRPVYFEEHRLPASYANFLITNGRVLVPIYNCDRDAGALETLQSLFPGRQVVGIDCTKLVWGLGAIHCVTQQQPAIFG